MQDSPFAVQVLMSAADRSSTPLVGVSEVTCGSSGFCIALTRYGQVFGWGSNEFSQMAIAPGGSFSIAVPIYAGPNGIDAIAAGAAHAIAHSSRDGNVYGWGYNGRGQLGAGFASVAQFPAVVMSGGPSGMNDVSKLAAGGDSSFMVRYLDRMVFVAGDNQSGQLGIPGNQEAQYLPVSSALNP
jgi:alpha-tubulin suppressor-like RCC1 family protein